MKKLLGIVALGLLFSGNAYPNTIKDMVLVCESNERNFMNSIGDWETFTK